jgi:hypothetical protein
MIVQSFVSQSAGCGQGTRTVRLENTRGQVRAIKVTVYGWKAFLLIDTVPRFPWRLK